MTRVEIPTYGVIAENEFYGRKTTGLLTHGKRNEPSTEVLWISRYKTPTKEEVKDFIINEARKIKAKNKKEKKEPNIFSNFPFLIDLLIQKEEDLLIHLSNHYQEGDIQSGRTYLAVRISDISDVNLDEAKKLEKKRGKTIYKICVENCGLNQRALRVRLSENNSLPETSELEYLVDRGVRVSDVFAVHGECQDYSKIAELIRLIYNSLDADKVKQIIDVSSIFTEAKARATIDATGQCIAMGTTLRNLPDILGNLFKQRKKLE